MMEKYIVLDVQTKNVEDSSKSAIPCVRLTNDYYPIPSFALRSNCLDTHTTRYNLDHRLNQIHLPAVQLHLP